MEGRTFIEEKMIRIEQAQLHFCYLFYNKVGNLVFMFPLPAYLQLSRRSTPVIIWARVDCTKI